MSAGLSARGMVARAAGIVAIALGFAAGMQGLDEPRSFWLPTALGLLVTGVLAQGYALYCGIRRWREHRDTQREDT